MRNTTVAGVSTPSGLTRLLEAELARFPSRSGLYVKHLPTGEEAAVRADEIFDSVSTIKIAIMVVAFRLADADKLDLDERYEIKPSDLRGMSGVLQHFRAPALPGARARGRTRCHLPSRLGRKPPPLPDLHVEQDLSVACLV